jgi:hypothetical protein
MRLLESIIHQLTFIAPMIVVSLVGVVLSLVHFNRLGKPAAFALIGCGMLFINIAAFPFLQGYLTLAREERQWSMAQFGIWMNLLGYVRVALQTTAVALLLAAIFSRPNAAAIKPDPHKFQTDEL